MRQTTHHRSGQSHQLDPQQQKHYHQQQWQQFPRRCPQALEIKRRHSGPILGPRASTATEGDPATATNDTCSTDKGTAAGPTSSTDSTTERVTDDSDSGSLSSPSTTVDDPAAALSISSTTDAMTTPPAPDIRHDGHITPRKTTVVNKTEHKGEITGLTRKAKWKR